MQEMGVVEFHLWGHFSGHDQRLPPAATPVRGAVAPEVFQPDPPRRRIAGHAPRLPPCAQNPQRFLIQVFRQVADPGFDLVVNRMGLAIIGKTQRPDLKRQVAVFQRFQFLRDESLGQSRIALQDHRKRRRHSAAFLVGHRAALRSATVFRPSIRPEIRFADGFG